MKNFLLGLFVGALVGVGVTYAVVKAQSDRVTSAVVPDEPKEDKNAPARRRRVPRVPPRPEGEPAPTLSEADLKVGAEGDALRVKARTVDLGSAGEQRDLTQDEIDGAIHARGDEIIACVVQARGAAELSGRIELGLVVTASGSVSQTRVEAPAYLLRQGLYRCVRPKLLAMRFPAVGKDTIIHVPFDLK